MNLQQSLENAIDFTRRLQAALEIEDLEISQDLLVLRGEAMQVFEQQHRAADEATRRAAAPLLEELKEVDANLQRRQQEVLEENASLLRDSVINTAPAPRQAYNTTEPPSCVDRRA